MVEGEVAAGLEDAAARGEHEVQVGGVAERRGGHPDAARRRRAAAADPAAPMQLDLSPPGASIRMDSSRSDGKNRCPWSAVTTRVRRRPRRACESRAPGCR